MFYIRLLYRLINLFLFLLASYAYFMANDMLSSLYGPVSIELEFLNRYFGLALIFASILLYRVINLRNNDLFICILLIIFFVCNIQLLNLKTVQLTLGHFLIFFRITIYCFVLSLIISLIYILRQRIKHQ